MNPYPNITSVRLKCACPPSCICKSSELREWSHLSCSKYSYLSAKGDIFCNQQGCKSYFIKDASFQCQQAKQNSTFYQYKSAAQFIMALAMAIQAADLTLKDNDLIKFTTDINSEVMKRWNL
ncbi:unnamed protein product [Paramecium pentaurelia]|uniref:Uncharacterized protein n=1 Tax=Paramecium pentaurelia TaxID=43138 RepID=A0A8S1WSS1_9CILI|nr:unnamed protein product [Paramecium pentaurelia]